jgi:hypothetical protein
MYCVESMIELSNLIQHLSMLVCHDSVNHHLSYIGHILGLIDLPQPAKHDLDEHLNLTSKLGMLCLID